MRRNHEVKVRLNDDEFNELNHKVAQSKMSREKFIRHCIHKKKVKTPPDINYYQFITECNMIGNNLNQIARKLNGTNTYSDEMLNTTIYELRSFIKKLDEKVRGD